MSISLADIVSITIIPFVILIYLLFFFSALFAIVFYVASRQKKPLIYEKKYRFYRNTAIVLLSLICLGLMPGYIPGCPIGIYKGSISINSYYSTPSPQNTNDVSVNVNFTFEPNDPGYFFISHEGNHLRDFPAVYYYWIKNLYTFIKYSKIMSYVSNPPKRIKYLASFTMSKDEFKNYVAQKQFDLHVIKEATVKEMLPGGCLPYFNVDAYKFSSTNLNGQLIAPPTLIH